MPSTPVASVLTPVEPRGARPRRGPAAQVAHHGPAFLFTQHRFKGGHCGSRHAFDDETIKPAVGVHRGIDGPDYRRRTLFHGLRDETTGPVSTVLDSGGI